MNDCKYLPCKQRTLLTKRLFMDIMSVCIIYKFFFTTSYLVIVLVGVLICEIFSKKSSLNDRARRANFVPRKLPLWPEEPGYPPDDGVIVPLSQSAKKVQDKIFELIKERLPHINQINSTVYYRRIKFDLFLTRHNFYWRFINTRNTQSITEIWLRLYI